MGGIMLTPDDVKIKRGEIISQYAQEANKIIEVIKQEVDALIIQGLKDKTFTPKNGTLTFSNLGVILTKLERDVITEATINFFEANGWVVDGLSFETGDANEGQPISAKMYIKLSARYGFAKPK
jgi:predicted TIM-barrel enzyme